MQADEDKRSSVQLSPAPPTQTTSSPMLQQLCGDRAYIGGIPSTLKSVPRELMGVKAGLKGVVHSVRMNEVHRSLENEPLIHGSEQLTGITFITSGKLLVTDWLL